MWTNEQKAAIDLRGSNILVSAAAGSGKTAVLVERIIERVCDHTDPIDVDRLLIVTFTNAAALEMRERIGDGITKRLQDDPSNTHIQKQLHLLQRSSISTIHSFCLGIIKKYFYQIDIDPVFRIGSEAELNLIKSEVLDEVLEELFEEGEEDFLRLADSYTSAKNADLLRNTILRIYTFAQSTTWPNEWLDEQVSKLLKDYKKIDETPWGEVLYKDTQSDLKSVIKACEEAIEICSLPNGPVHYMEMVEDDLNQILEIQDNDTDLIEFTNDLSSIKFMRLSGKREECDEDLKDEVKDIRNNYIKSPINKAKETLQIGSEEDLLSRIYETGIIMRALVKVVKKFSEEYQEVKAAKSLADYNDLEHYCLEILIDRDEDGDKQSKVAKELQEFYEEIYIDEYQDSNVVQETILKSISKDDNNRFMVGDLKQSIYRFRLANPYLFKEKEDNYIRWKADKEINESVSINLQKNFRSRASILNGINYIFEQIMSLEVGDVNYNEDVALNPGLEYEETGEGEEAGGPIELHIIEKDKKPKDDEKDNEVELVTSKIQVLLSESSTYKVFDKDLDEYRKVKPRDIVILLRSTVNRADKYADRLEELGIRSFADISTGYFETIEVKTVIALLSIIDNPRQDIPLLSVLRSPVIGLSLDDIATIRASQTLGNFYEAVKGYIEENEALEQEDELLTKLKKFIKDLDSYRKIAIELPVDELISLLLKESGYYQYVSMLAGGEQKQANLRILKKHALDFEDSSYTGLFNFMNYIDRIHKTSGDFSEAKVFGENEDLVRIMSIHKSKGLEFPIVFLVNTDKRFNQQDLRDSILVHNEYGLGARYIDTDKMVRYNTLPRIAISKQIENETMSEEMRILYVALTRAKEKLILTGVVNNLERSITKWGRNIQNVKSSNNYLDWIGSALYNDLENLDESMFRIYHKEQTPIDEEKESDYITKEELEKWDTQKQYGENKEKISEILGWEYAYKEATNLPVKMTVTEIKQRWQELDETSEYISFNPDNIKTKPNFIEDVNKITPAARGTMIHNVFQHLDLKNSNTYKEVEDQIYGMIETGKVEETITQVVDFDRLVDFASSPIVKRINNADKVYKEQQFVYLIDAKKIDEEFKDLDYKEDIMVQGVADCFFVEDNEVILIDYKTDYIPDGPKAEQAIEQTKNNYKKQIDIYAQALEGITKMPVTERYLYLYSANKWVNI